MNLGKINFFAKMVKLKIWSPIKKVFKINFMANSPKKPRASYQDKMNVIHTKSRRGDQKRISEMTGYSASYVSAVLSAQYNNDEIVNCAYKIMRPRK